MAISLLPDLQLWDVLAGSNGDGEQLLVPWMPSMGGLEGNLPPDVHIVGFGRTVNVFSSKQRPKELTIYGSDFKCASAYFCCSKIT